MFIIPNAEMLAKLTASATSEMREIAVAEIAEIRAASTRETITQDQADRIEALLEFVDSADAHVTASMSKATVYDREVPAAPKAPEVQPFRGLRLSAGRGGPTPRHRFEKTQGIPSRLTALGTDASIGQRRVLDRGR